MKKKKKNSKLLIDFFAKNLSEKQKVEFLHKAAHDREFLKEFIRTIEIEEAFNELYEKRKPDRNASPEI